MSYRGSKPWLFDAQVPTSSTLKDKSPTLTEVFSDSSTLARLESWRTATSSTFRQREVTIKVGRSVCVVLNEDLGGAGFGSLKVQSAEGFGGSLREAALSALSKFASRPAVTERT